MTLSEFKVIFWWEWAHRFLGRLIGISFLLPLLYFTFKIFLIMLAVHVFLFISMKFISMAKIGFEKKISMD